MKNRSSRPSTGPLPAPGNRQGGGSGAAMPNFVNPFDKCPSCGAKGDKMKSTWDGMRKVQWTCGYCGTLAGVQELKDEELPASAKARLGISQAPGQQNMMGGPGPGYQGGGTGVGGLLTGMMIGNMLGGGHHDNSGDGGFGSGGAGGTSSNSDWGESGGSGWGDSGSSDSGSSDSGGGWGDSGGGDSGGGDSGGGGGGDW